MSKGVCTLALDLGTSAFKAAWVDEAGRIGPVATVNYRIDRLGSSVTCPPARYFRSALRALRQAAESASAAKLIPAAIGITSQAQTFIIVNEQNEAIGPAVVWLDSDAVPEAELAASALTDFDETSGFSRPSPLQFLPKVIKAHHSNTVGGRYLLLNEWLIYRLTDRAFGDTNSQGMAGFWNISSGKWNERALNLAGIQSENLATVDQAGSISAQLSIRAQQLTGLPPIPVYSCGNDQSCAAIGAGLEEAGDLFCNFGTALVVYGLSDRYHAPTGENQIAGVAPLPSLWFLLGVESECGSVLDQLARKMGPSGGVGGMIADALESDIDISRLPDVRILDGNIDIDSEMLKHNRHEYVRAILERYCTRFGEILDEITAKLGKPKRIFVGGGLSQSKPWLNLLEKRHGITFIPSDTEHPGLRGAARVISRAHRSESGTQV